MSTQSSKVNRRFNELLEFDNEEDQLEHQTQMLMFKFLSIVDQEMETRNISRKDLAELLGTSPSYITQIFRGTKTVNLSRLAQMQEVLGLEFQISTSLTRSKSSLGKTKIQKTESGTRLMQRKRKHAL